MAIMEVRLVQRYYDQLIINSWNYLSTGTPAAVSRSFALTNAMGFIAGGVTLPADTIGRAMQQIQVGQVNFEMVTVRDVYSNVDFYETAFLPGTVGTAEGTGLNTFDAYAFVSSKSRYDIKRGQKRVTGVSESAVAAGGAIESAFLAGQMQDLADAMSETLEYLDEGQPIEFQPIIVAKEKVEVPDSDPIRYTYKYYVNQAVQEANIMTSIVWSPQPYTSTQNSRKRGRGA